MKQILVKSCAECPHKQGIWVSWCDKNDCAIDDVNSIPTWCLLDDVTLSVVEKDWNTDAENKAWESL